MDKQIKYRAGYKYQLAENYVIDLNIKIDVPIDTEYINLTTSGILTIKEGYAWDGASGPTWDDKSNMRGSLVHDALYQLLREKRLPLNYRQVADDILFQLCKEDGMSTFRATIWRTMVGSFAGGAALPQNDKEILTAPNCIYD